MKPHLPTRLLRALVCMMAAAPSVLYAKYTAPTEIIVPDSYTNAVELSGTAEITSQTVNTAYRLTGDVTMSPSNVSLSGGSLWFTSDSANNLASLSFTKPANSVKIAFSVNSSATFDSLDEVSFTSFSGSPMNGGAVSVNSNANLLYSNNAKVSFNTNKAAPGGPFYMTNGGAIYASSNTEFRDNYEIIFSGNEATYQGGAISIQTKNKNIKFHENDNVTFTGNKTSGTQNSSHGGALHSLRGNILLTHNGNVSFSSNSSTATGTNPLSQGGAIYSSDNYEGQVVVDLSYNDSLTFTGNKAQGSGDSLGADGGAIFAAGTDLRLNNNGSLTFRGNTAYTTSSTSSAEGGAIRIGANSVLSIQNNGSVIFEDNKTQVGNTIKYNSIYVTDYNLDSRGNIKPYEVAVKISAPEEGSIEFRDCAYIDVSHHENASFNLNTKYTDENGQEIAQTGSIIFTGEYMTDGDKTSEFKGKATLHDGKLVVKEGAVLKAGELVVAESASGESTPTVSVENATLTTEKLTIVNGGTLVNNNGTITTTTEPINVTNGTVMGSGRFSALTMDGGDLIVGNSPGRQIFDGDVVLNNVDVIFSISDFTSPATAETHSWASGVYSVLDLNGHNLVLGDDVNIVIELGGLALEQVLSHQSINFEMDIFQNIDELTIQDKTFADLLNQTTFVVTTDEDALVDSPYVDMAGVDVSDMITTTFYSESEGETQHNVSLKVNIAGAVPEPTTATLSLLALAGLAARRRRK